MKIHLYTSHEWGLGDWNYLSPMSPGIGGSETCQIEMAWRLARRGYEVTSYAPLPAGTNPEWRGTLWRHSREADFSEEGLWVLSRCPEVLDHFGPCRPEQPRWLVCQDTYYDTMTEARAAKLDVLFGLCPIHCALLKREYPYAADKLMLSANGIRSDAIRALLKRPPVARNPKRLIWTSSPDRGLETALSIFARVREFVPDVELHAFYGFDNIDRIIAREPGTFWLDIKARVLKALDQPGVHWGGRIGQEQLYEELLKSAIWLYPSEFSETGCISTMEAQACGAIPVTNLYWAQGFNTRHGVVIDGEPWQDSFTRACYAAELLKLLANPADQETIRAGMQLQALYAFNWERVVDQYDALLGGYEDRVYYERYGFQIKYARGKVLNVGCNEDAPGFGKIEGNVNVDLHEVDHQTKRPNAPHLHADARQLPEVLWNRFDTVVLGDLVEHLHDLDMVSALNNAKRATVRGGQVLVTFPTDDRPEWMQDPDRGQNKDYAPGIPSHHARVLTKEHFEKLLTETGMRVQLCRDVDYGFCGGHGYVLA
jgi:glycosyltransferase involved in cell wall biosynthesis